MGLVDGQQAKYVHGGPSKRSMCQKVDRFNVTHVAVSDTDANAAAAPRPDWLPAQQLIAIFGDDKLYFPLGRI